MKHAAFGLALRNFVDRLELGSGRARWFDQEVRLDPRYLRRWQRGDYLPSEGNWAQVALAVRRRWSQNATVMARFVRLERLISSERKKTLARQPAKKSASELRSNSDSANHQVRAKGIVSAPTPKDLFRRFQAETHIAAHLATPAGTRSLYLESVYVHRKVEAIAIGIVEKYLAAKEATGLWLSVAGDAGHGKTSLLWFLSHEIKKLSPRILPLQAQQLPGKPSEALRESALLLGVRPFFVILDTLDLLVGIDDGALGAVINEIRACGGLLITACRRQELHNLARHVRSDSVLELNRFDPDEAKAAIESYVWACYADWPENRKALQFQHVWELLEQQRRIQDLSFEPLILRMLFEVYFPEDIPRDINTQKVYDRFWMDRVVSDRSFSDPAIGRDRGRVCQVLAAHLYFGTDAHSEQVSTESQLVLCVEAGIQRPLALLEGLVSSGVLRWWHLRASVGFFHQTFLEYAAAKQLLELADPDLRRKRVHELLMDVERPNLFRVPVLKQLMIQASAGDRSLYEHLCAQLPEVNTPLAARLAVEVLGKADDAGRLDTLVRAWGAREPELFRSVVPEIVRHFPASRIDIALDLLKPHLESESAGEIYYLCEEVFAQMAPASTLAFLGSALSGGLGITPDLDGRATSALMATLKAGELGALAIFRKILPKFRAGMQAFALNQIGEVTIPENAPQVAEFLADLFPEILRSETNESRAGFTNAVAALHRSSRSQCRMLAERLQSGFGASDEMRTRNLVARVRGIADPEPNLIDEALRGVLTSDHLRRLSASDLLHEAVKNDPSILDRLLSLPLERALSPDSINAIYWIASGSRNPEGVFSVLDRWPPNERGAGTAYRALLENAAGVDRSRTLAWVKERMSHTRTGGQRRQVLVGFQILAEHATAALTPADVRLFFEWGFAHPSATDEMRRVFASSTAKIAEVDEQLAENILRRIFQSRKQDHINAAVNSLRSTKSTEFVLYVLNETLSLVRSSRRYAILGHFLAVVADGDESLRTAVVKRLGALDAKTLLSGIDDPVVASRLLGLLKSTARADVEAAFDLCQTCPILDDGNAATLAAVLQNVSWHIQDPPRLRGILDRLLELAAYPQDRIRNSLVRALRVLDKRLPFGQVPQAILNTILTRDKWDEKALANLVRAAKHVESWTRDDTEALLRSNLPQRAKAILLS